MQLLPLTTWFNYSPALANDTMTTPQPGNQIPAEDPIAHLVEAAQFRVASQRIKLAKATTTQRPGKLQRT